MASLKDLKLRINSVKSTQKITKAMKMVAAAKLRRATERAEAGRPYATRLQSVVSSLASRITVGPQSPKLIAGTGKDETHLIIVATADKGLAGAFSGNIVKAARAKAEELIADGREVYFYVVGRKSRPILNRFFPGKIIGQHDTSAIKNPAYSDAQAIADDIIDRFESGRFDVAHLAYAEFKSTLSQVPQVDQLIPVVPAEADEGKGASAAVEYEPGEEEILADLLPKNVAIQIYRAMLENQAGFYGSQMTAMDNATRNAGDMINKLSIRYNRQRQAAITTELVEIISGAEAL
ncbi:F0F1 ATP synthase subunit gamma [Sphingomicrobium lutaoense]|uniref:ATP synthase gamma chain n=1 Tax=Sphingomicrobium lutaoense TaxID=515949 RepID=A0A839YYF3_9SPHN|nr:F0F1 ATP synthase subunit gamma [Sphingomicrobium lutaoense]MBB3763348.1 F-type H+-transporting ATPase subunit gamma [Sphingomicrobium lutaoense]